ncbi:MAG TPA: hypothetical protein EYQ14_11090 [Gammaproteobacteria bacterium]|nr:hypothetical protein [Gammaproteobacteria bacterium]
MAPRVAGNREKSHSYCLHISDRIVLTRESYTNWTKAFTHFVVVSRLTALGQASAGWWDNPLRPRIET